ncbi:MAG: ABC transporter substrate-binding protein [Thermomicrobiales bacterium]|nr:ABC transporter substrate-binding protein [Thermomicrobiales bacterium]
MNRRTLLATTGIAGIGSLIGRGFTTVAQTARAEQLTIDLGTEPALLDPARTYDADGWSIVHSVFDSLLQYAPDGAIEPLLAESFTLLDPLTYRVVLRPDIAFHNGEPLDASAIEPSIAHILAEETASQVAANFAVIESVEVIDELTADLHLSSTAPWLPAQIAAWLCLLPPQAAQEPDFFATPIGTGPYRFESFVPGDRVSLTANDDYFAASPKGRPVADRLDYRFVADATTRVADLLSGTSDIVRAVPIDQIGAVENNGDVVLQTPISGSAFVRVPTDVAPFDDVRVREAMNHAVDVESIIAALLDGNGQRLANFFVPGGLGYDPDLAPYSFDPERARALLAEAGYPDGFDTSIDATVTERSDIVEAVAAMLSDVGIRTTVNRLELALFNSGDYWLGTDPAASPLRFATWRPLFDPHTLLSLVVSNAGFLSRHDNPRVQELIDAFAAEADPDARAQIGLDLGVALFEEPAAIYLYSLTSSTGQRAGVPEWSPRPDDYLIATLRP